MKKLNRFVSMVVLAAFLTNSVFTDLAFSQISSDKLAVPSRFSDLLGPQGQDMSRIRFILAGHIAGARDGDGVNLSRLIESVSTYRDSKENHKAPVEFEPLQVFGHEMKPLPSNMMYVMCRVRHRFLGLHTYYAVFPRAWEGEGFPIEVYTDKEWNENKIYEFLTDSYMPKRSDHHPDIAKAIERDVAHQGFDSVLQWVHDPANRADYVRPVDSIGMDYRLSILGIMTRLTEFGITILGPDNRNIRSISDRRASIVVTAGPVKERLVRNMVNLKAIDGTPLDIVPAAHLSNNYLNTLLTPQEIKTLSKGGKSADRIKNDITARWVHEVGVSVGLPIIFFDELRPVNLFDLLWKHNGDWGAVRRELDERKIDAMTAGFRADNIYKVQDLDINIETRDVASLAGLWNSLTGQSKDSLPKKVLSALGIRDGAGVTVTPIHNMYKMVVTRSGYLSLVKSSSNDIWLKNIDARNGHYVCPKGRYLFVRSSDHEATVYDLMAPNIEQMAILKDVEDWGIWGSEYPFDKSSRFIRVHDSSFIEIIYDLQTRMPLPPKVSAPVAAKEARDAAAPAPTTTVDGAKTDPVALVSQETVERPGSLLPFEGAEAFTAVAMSAGAESATSFETTRRESEATSPRGGAQEEAKVGKAVEFEISVSTANGVIKAFEEFFEASIGSSRQKKAIAEMERYPEAVYAFTREMLFAAETGNDFESSFGKNAKSAYESARRASKVKGAMTKGDPRFNNLKALMDKMGRMLPFDSPLKERAGKSAPGKNWQAALKTIVFAKALQVESFTVTEYLATYQEAASVFGFEALAKRRPDDTARRDFNELMKRGYLRKVEDRRGEYALTEKGKSEVARLSEELDPVINKDPASFIPQEILSALETRAFTPPELRRPEEKTALTIGVPTEIKEGAERVGLTPAGVRALVSLGATVIVQKGAGQKAGFTDEKYINAGARMVDSAQDVWAQADIIKKVKEPLDNPKVGVNELELMRQGQIVYTYLHLASPDCNDLTYAMYRKGVTGIAYETIIVVDEHGKKRTPALEPMSIIAGHLGGYFGVIYSLWSETVKVEGKDTVRLTGAGKNMMARVKSDYTHAQGFREVAKGKKAVVMGGGISGLAAARTLLKCGVQVTVTDADPDRVEELKQILSIYGKRAEVILVSRDINSPSPDLLKRYQEADMLYGCILIPGAPAPQVSPELMAKISKKELGGKPKSAVINIAIDQGGNFPESHSTYYDDPVYFDSLGNMMFSVANMPDFVGGIASVALEKTNIADTAALVLGFGKALELSPRLKGGVNIHEGHLFVDALSKKYPDIPMASFTVTQTARSKERGNLSDLSLDGIKDLLSKYGLKESTIAERAWIGKTAKLLCIEAGLTDMAELIEKICFVQDLGRNVEDTEPELYGKVKKAFKDAGVETTADALIDGARQGGYLDASGQPDMMKYAEHIIGDKLPWDLKTRDVVEGLVAHENRTMRMLAAEGIIISPLVGRIINAHHDFRQGVSYASSGERLALAIIRMSLILSFANRNVDNTMQQTDDFMQGRIHTENMGDAGTTALGICHKLLVDDRGMLFKYIEEARAARNPTLVSREGDNEFLQHLRTGGTPSDTATSASVDQHTSRMYAGVAVPPQLEMLQPIDRTDIKLAALDWDGTISRIREGWEGIMTPMVAALISGIQLTEDEWKGILECVKNNRPVDKKYLVRLSDESMAWALEMINETKGEPTPTQFGRACEEARKRGNGAIFQWALDYYRAKGETIDETNPQKYFCKYYLEKLYELRDYRLALVDSGAVSPGEYLVKGGVEFIRMLVGSGVRVVIVTGSDQKGVQQEVDILGLGDLVEVTGYDVDKDIASKYDVIKNLRESSGYKASQILVMGDGKVEIKAGMDLGCKTIALRSRDNEGVLFNTKILPLRPHGIMSSHFEPVSELVDFFLPEQKVRREALFAAMQQSMGQDISRGGAGVLDIFKEVNLRRQQYFAAEMDMLLKKTSDISLSLPDALRSRAGRKAVKIPEALDKYLRYEAALIAKATLEDASSYCNQKLLKDKILSGAAISQTKGGAKYVVEVLMSSFRPAYRDAMKRYYGYFDVENLPEGKLAILKGLLESYDETAKSPKAVAESDLRSDMNLGLSAMQDISTGMVSHMSAGLKGEPSSLDMTPTFVTAPTGKEKGDYFAIDVGGSNLRVMGVRLDGKGGYTEIGKQKIVEFQARHKTGTQQELFGFIAEAVRSYFAENGINMSGEIRMGLSWSFPVDLTGIASARHKEWTKGWSVSGVVGEDIVSLLHASFERSGIGNAKVVALCNDTTGTLAAARYAGYSDCVGGMVLGTGWNAAFELLARHIGKWVAFDSPSMMVNTEWENYALPLLTKWDKELDTRPEVHGKQMLEKHVSGKYLGEIARLIIRDLISQNKMFKGNVPAVFANAPVELGKDGFLAEHMSGIEFDTTPDLTGVRDILKKLGATGSSLEDRRMIKSVCELVSTRSAQIVAAATDALVTYVESTSPRDSYSIAVDGSLYEKYPHFAQRIYSALKLLRPDDYNKIKFVTAKDGSGVGAAIIAAATSSKPAFPQTYNERKAVLEKLAKERGFLPFLGTGAIPLYNEANGTDHSLESVMNNAELQADILIWAIEEFELSGIPAMMDLTIETEAALLANIPENKRVEILKSFGRSTISKFDGVRVPQMEPDLVERAGTEWWKNPKEFDVRQVGRMRIQAQTIKRLKAHFGNSKVIAGYVVSPYTLTEHFMGSNMMSGHDIFTSMLSETEEFKALMAYSEKLIAQYAQFLIESGADVIAMLDPTPTGNLKPDNAKVQSIEPVNRLARLIRQHGALAAFHPCEPTGNEHNGDIEYEYLKTFAGADVDILSLDAVYDSGKVSVEMGPVMLDKVYDFIEQNSAAKPVIIGSVNTKSTLPNGTPEEVAASVNKQINSLANKARGYLIGSSCDITTTLANMRAFARAVANNGKFTNAIQVPKGHHPDLKEVLPGQSGSYRYGGDTYSVGRLLVPSNPNRIFTPEELFETGTYNATAQKRVIVESDDMMTYMSADILTSIMNAAQFQYTFGLATGGTTEAVRKLMGLGDMIKSLYGVTLDTDKIRKICTLDNYYFNYYLKRNGFTPEEADKIIEISSYESEQLYMMIKNLMGGDVKPGFFIAPPGATDKLWFESAEEFKMLLAKYFCVERFVQLWQLHGLGTNSHDAFNEVYARLKRELSDITLELYRDGMVKRALLQDGTDLAKLGLTRLPPFKKIPDQFAQMGMMRDDHPSLISFIIKVQNNGHFLTLVRQILDKRYGPGKVQFERFHPFFLKYMGDNSLYDVDELISAILLSTPEQLLKYTNNPKYHFKDMEDFTVQLQFLLDMYASVPEESTSQGIGATIHRGSLRLPDGNYPVQLVMACAAHKQLALMRALQWPSEWSTSSTLLHLAKNVLLVATEESLGMVLDSETMNTFIKVRPDKADRIAGLDKRVEEAWGKTPPGRRINGILEGENKAQAANAGEPATPETAKPTQQTEKTTAGIGADLETARFNTSRAKEVIEVIVKSNSLQRLIEKGNGFNLSDYTAVCPDSLQNSARADLDLLVDRGVLVLNGVRNYMPAQAWIQNMNNLRKGFVQTGNSSDDDALIEGRHLLNGMSDLASQVGLEMPTIPSERYRLLLPQSCFADGELDNDKNKFGDRFQLDAVQGATGNAFVRNVIRLARGNESRTIAMIPSNLELTDTNLQDLQRLGIGLVRVDADALSELRFAPALEREQFRTDAYAIMWLARYVKDATPESGAYELLRFYLKTHFAFAEASQMDAYINALVKGELAKIVKVYLKFRPSVPKDAEADYHKVAASLIFA